jgi:bifunctional non-homologous end joining protein LigD
MLRKLEYQPCIPTRGTKVPAGPDWLHEIKDDGYRLIVQRDGKRVRLLTRRGYDWSDRYPLIAEAALRLRKTSFVIDGEAVVLGPDGISAFDGCTAEGATKKSDCTAALNRGPFPSRKPFPHLPRSFSAVI